jgi:small subunit ribosomal protein S16
MLVIRLRRTGKIHQPTYRIVVTDQRKSVNSPYIEKIGEYNPKTKVILLDKEKAYEWMKKGAKPSDTISKIFKKEGLEHKSIVIKTYRAVSKKELEAQKAQAEAEKAKEQAEKEAAKEAFEEKVEAEKAAAPSSEEKLQEAATESIEEVKKEETEKAAEKPAEKPETVEEKPAEPEKPNEPKA